MNQHIIHTDDIIVCNSATSVGGYEDFCDDQPSLHSGLQRCMIKGYLGVFYIYLFVYFKTIPVPRVHVVSLSADPSGLGAAENIFKDV